MHGLSSDQKNLLFDPQNIDSIISGVASKRIYSSRIENLKKTIDLSYNTSKEGN